MQPGPKAKGADSDARSRDALDVRLAHEVRELEDARKRIDNVSAQSASIVTVLVAIVAVTATAIAGGGGLHTTLVPTPGLFWGTGGVAVFLLVSAAASAIIVRTPPRRTTTGEVRARVDLLSPLWRQAKRREQRAARRESSQRVDTALRAFRNTEFHDPTATRQAVLALTMARRDAVESWARYAEQMLSISTYCLYFGVSCLLIAAFYYLYWLY